MVVKLYGPGVRTREQQPMDEQSTTRCRRAGASGSVHEPYGLQILPHDFVPHGVDSDACCLCILHKRVSKGLRELVERRAFTVAVIKWVKI